ncbi:MAG: M81 family metallopeptidase [Gammaproteobacteria bacterium]|nr:M81 family metallopeptidase [Gammaproteobacteria bacterium]
MQVAVKRIAILGFHLEANRFAEPCTEADFLKRGVWRGAAISDAARVPNPTIDSAICGFYKVMDDHDAWEPVPIVFAAAFPDGPADQDFFERLLDEMRKGLAGAGPLDGVYCCEHGAGLAVGHDDPDGEVFEIARKAVGPDVPVIATLDLHANISARMLECTDMLISYVTNPHVDAYERGQEAARAMLEVLHAGTRPAMASIRLPLVAPSVTLLTAAGHPYGDVIRLGQTRLGGDIMNVSITGGFAFSDTDRNGMTVTVTARGDRAAAAAVARELASAAWADRARYQPRMTSLQAATERALAAARDPASPPLLFCDPADNPGGGGRGNTTFILKAFAEAGVEDALLGVFYDPPLVEAARAAGVGAEFEARFNSTETQAFSEPWQATAKVLELSDGEFVGQYGMVKGRRVRLGQACLLAVGGIRVVVISVRQQCLSNDFFTHFGVDAANARVTVVKSRGHFRAGFKHLFAPEQIIEVDVPGLTSCNLANFDWQHLPRPVYPLDPETSWSVPAA